MSVSKRAIQSLVCPYCQSSFQLKKQGIWKKQIWGYLKCTCDTFPIVYGIPVILRIAGNKHRLAVDAISQQKYLKATTLVVHAGKAEIFFSLAVISIGNFQSKFIFLALNLLKTVLLPKNWLKYIDKRNEHRDTSIFQKQYDPNQSAIDIGCGTAAYLESINSKNTYFGIDSHLPSLVLAQHYQEQKNRLFLCLDVRDGLPLAKNLKTSQVYFVDSFCYISTQYSVLQSTLKHLKKNGKVLLINVYPINKTTKKWGYGISNSQIKSIFGDKFRVTQIHKNMNGPEYSLKIVRK